MKPVLSAWPPKKRTVAFPAFAAGIFLLSFIIVAFATQNFFLALMIPPVLAVGGAYALVGWPELQTKSGKPLVEPQHKPYLFFVLAPLFAIVLYPILGIALTQARLPLKWVAIASIVLSIGIGVAAAYFLVGVPNLVATVRRKYEEIPPERRPFLFFPLFVVLFLILYLFLGVVSTRLMGRVSPGDPTALLNVQVLVLLPITVILAATIAWLIVGIPKPTKAPAEYLPKVTGKHRRRVFFGTFIVAAIPLTITIGAILTYYTPLPPTPILAISVALGLLMALGIAVLAWGTPARWRRFEDYQPGIDPRARTPLFVGISLAVAILAAVGIGLANIDLFWGLLVGLVLGGTAFILLTGTHKRVVARRGQETLVPDLPDKMKPLILFPTWLGIAFVLFAILTYLLPGIVALNALVAVVTGLVVTFFLLEAPLLRDLRVQRAEEKRKRKEWEERRKARLAEAETAREG